MELETLLENFDAICELPSGIDKVRSHLQFLAIQGRLTTEMQKTDFKHKSKVYLFPFENYNKSKSLGLPKSWEVVPLKAIIACNFHGKTPAKSNSFYWNGAIPWVSSKNIGSTKYVLGSKELITEKALEECQISVVPPYSLLLSVRMSLGKVSINTVPIVINQDLRALSFCSDVLVEYIYIFFLCSSLEGSGATVKGIQNEDLLNILVPVPSIIEQKEIVQKVEKLMHICDRVQTAKENRDTLHKKLGNKAT